MNTSVIPDVINATIVLIDTWWNVNFVTSRQLMNVEQPF
ncbi:hypothetical protein CLOL250_00476 [Clostridium sp. L2-50]|nr:hypothetical protein CLOL250_00476 [Clostridium sp. L2-50]